jgi:hypothetical protein
MANYVYGANGALVNVQNSSTDKVFFGGQEVPYISATQLQRYAAIIYAEAASSSLVAQINPTNPAREMERECMAIAITMYNYARAKNAALARRGQTYGLNELVYDSGYTKGILSPNFSVYFGAGGDDAKRRVATLSVIRLFMRQFSAVPDLLTALQGAQYWDGNDLFRLFRTHYRAKKGFELSNSAHGRAYQNVRTIAGTQIITSVTAQDPAIAALRQYTFMSTMTAGGTIFFRIHPQAAAQGITW